MRYGLILLEDATSSLKRMSPEVSRRVLRKIERMRDDLAGDVKRLVAFEPSYRLRVGDWRVLFDVESGEIIVYDVIHRSKAYE